MLEPTTARMSGGRSRRPPAGGAHTARAAGITRTRGAVRESRPRRGLRSAALPAAVLALALGMSGCAGGVGGGAGGEAGGGEGVEYGASPEEYQAALEDMEPVTLTYQGGGASAESGSGKAELEFAQRVEELTGGKVTFEMAWGQSVAPFDEVTEAVADGRIDIGVEIPIYTPSKYEAIGELISLSPSTPSSPVLTEVATTAAALETAWDTPEVVENYEEMGATVLRPMFFETSNALMCTEPVTSAADFRGKQIRVGSASDFTIVEALDASPVSMQFTEAYEALQRNTIDCTLGGLRIGADYGFLEVAPHVSLPQDGAWGRNPTALVAGPGYERLPLAAKQAIFDSFEVFTGAGLTAMIDSSATAVGMIEDNGGEVARLEDDAESAFQGAVEELRAQVEASDALDGAAAAASFDEGYEKWAALAEESGIPAEDDYHAFAQEWEGSPLDLQPFGARIYEEIHLPRRPE
jgi:TRAP-type C4-dicarboxylate transport system substrate-binding protein